MNDRFAELKMQFWACQDDYLNRGAYVDAPWHCYMCGRNFDNTDDESEHYCDHIFDCHDVQYEALRTGMIGALLELKQEFQR